MDCGEAILTELSAALAKAEACVRDGKLEDAAAIYRHTLNVAPEDANLHHTLGLVYLEQKKVRHALHHIGRSIELNPSNATAFRSMGDTYRACGQFESAVSVYRRALALDPGNTDALLNLGNAYHELDRYRQALDAYHTILKASPDHNRALNNLGKVYQDIGQFETALTCYNASIQRRPDYAEARFNRSALRLSMGDYRHGWKEYEWRFKRSSAAHVYPHRLGTPRWQGENFKGRRLLVHCEQGMGDMLQFVRYIPMVKKRGGNVILEVHPPLVPLLAPHPWIDEIIAFDYALPPRVRHDLHIPLLSLPAIFGTEPATIPAAIPYIRIDGDAGKPWQRYAKKDCINIGLVWASSNLNPKRNLPIDLCGDWFRIPGLHFICLQKGDASGQIQSVNSHGGSIVELGGQLQNFRDTAAVLSLLDLVISVDTAVLHLAGAMGKPLWALLPFNADWRWSLVDRNISWYPHARIFRQSNPDNWDSVTTGVADQLRILEAPIIR
jgi:tetratricopeptide (TPR) repeat protein